MTALRWYVFAVTAFFVVLGLLAWPWLLVAFATTAPPDDEDINEP